MDVHLKIDNISKKYGVVNALQNINLEIERGSFVCLLGPSGCGKTTLLRIIAGFEQASSGQLLLDGKNISQIAPNKRDFGMVFQSLALFPHMSVAQNISYGLKLRGISGAKQRDRVDELLAMIDLPQVADRAIAELSGGQRQRVAIARALAVQPKLFLLDEPLSALDAKLRDAMQIELRQLQQKFGVTTILVTHDQQEAMMLADKVVILNGGGIQQAGSPASVYREPSNAFVADFFGANLIRGCATKDGKLALLGIETQHDIDQSSGSEVQVALRAENIDLVAPDQALGMPIGTLELSRDLGAAIELIVAVGDEKLRVRSNKVAHQQWQLGQKVGLSIQDQHYQPLRD
ncbi:MAG: putative spermidine/putrescine transport system ATP-binding protein [Oceanospirillaceae bacterium]|jgi:putative spermidine/putrescine transport system ATP-binding protein